MSRGGLQDTLAPNLSEAQLATLLQTLWQAGGGGVQPQQHPSAQPHVPRTGFYVSSSDVEPCPRPVRATRRCHGCGSTHHLISRCPRQLPYLPPPPQPCPPLSNMQPLLLPKWQPTPMRLHLHRRHCELCCPSSICPSSSSVHTSPSAVCSGPLP